MHYKTKIFYLKKYLINILSYSFAVDDCKITRERNTLQWEYSPVLRMTYHPTWIYYLARHRLSQLSTRY